MKITRVQLDEAVRQGILEEDQVRKLVAMTEAMADSNPRFDLTHILYYLGGLLAVGAMTLFMTLGWEQFGGWGILALSLVYGAAGLALLRMFRKRGLHVPAGICAVFVTILCPLAVYGLQQGMGWWVDGEFYRDYHRHIRWNWLFMELATLAAGAVMLYRFRYPFLVMPVAATLWYLSMDLAPWLAGGDRVDFQLRALVSLWFGLAVILLALWVDIRSRHSFDYAFWLYLAGVAAFWGGLTAQEPTGEFSRFCYCLLNFGLVLLGAVLVRKVFVLFGAIGISCYLGHLAASVFKNSWLFPLSLTCIGFAIVLCGLWWQNNEQRVTGYLRNMLPRPVRELLEARGER